MKVLAQKLLKQGDQSLERRSENPADGNPPKITKIKDNIALFRSYIF